MKTKQYRKAFAVLSFFSFATIFVTHIDQKPSWMVIRDGVIFSPTIASVFGFIILVSPFLICAGVFAWWATQGREFTRRAFICRASGVFLAYLIYLYWVWDFVNISTKLAFGLYFYPISIPFVMPGAYGIGYVVAGYIQKSLWNEKN